MKFSYAADARPVDGFTIRRGIHRGGFGEVYYAVSDAGKEVALKLLTHDLDTELRGIRQCLNLKHPNLITIFDVKTDSDGDCWVVMEYVNGSNLEEVLTAFPGGLPIREVQDWMSGLVAGVEYLHDRGLIHRDLKPANVYRENGTVKIGDVGLSKRFDGDRRNQHTESIGTVYYMAPEITHGKYGPAVDVYSLGVILYELLTGKLPFNGETSGEILMKQLSAAPDLTAVAPHLRPVLAHALEKDPVKRTSSARQLWQELEAVLSPPTNGNRPDAHAVRRDTDKSRDTDHKRRDGAALFREYDARHAQRSAAAQVRPARESRLKGQDRPYKQRRFTEFKLGLTVLVLALLFEPWQPMSPGDRGGAVWGFGLIGGFFLLLLWAREHWRPDHEPPWKLPFASRLPRSSPGDWAGSFALAALGGVVFSAVAFLSPHIFSGPPAGWKQIELFVFFTTVTVLGAWTVIGSGRLSGRSSWVRRHLRLLYAAGGLALATAAVAMQNYLLLDSLGDDLRGREIFDHLGIHPLKHLSQPTWLGYSVFFSGLFFLLGKRFGRMQDPQRPDRWMLRHVAAAAITAWLWVHVFEFQQLLGILWAAAIVASVQLAAPWQAPKTTALRN